MTNSLYRLFCVAGSLAAFSPAHAADQAKPDDTKAPATTPATSPGPSRAARGVEKIDINSADAAALQVLPGVDAKTADAIVAARPFQSVEDIARVPGIGDARMEILKEQITVTKADDAAAKADSAIKADTAAKADEHLQPTGRPSARSGEPDAAAATKVDLNSATLEELAALPEIGPEKAQAIISARPFSSVDDIKRVNGINPDALKDRVTVSAPAQAK